jgi:hypothetical protein
MAMMQKNSVEDSSIRTTLIASDLFWLGFIIYAASYAISATDEVNYVVCNLLQIIGLVLLLPSAIGLISLKIENNFLKVVFPIFILWQIWTVIRGVEFDYLIAKQLLFDPNLGMFLYLTPMAMLIPVNFTFLKKTFQAVVILCIVYLIYDLIFIHQLLFPYENMHSQAIFEYFTQQLSLAGGFLLLTFIYHSKKVDLFVLFTMLTTFILAVIRARRGLTFMTFTMMGFTYIIYQYYNKAKVINIVLSLFLVSVLTFAAVQVYYVNRKDTFGLITERIGQHTRSEVEMYFYRDMQPKDWIIGKGLNGEYFCPGVTEGIGRITIFRKVVETGYLQVVLNGGLISLALLLLIAIPAMIKGLFYSKNVLSKAAGIWIFLFLLYMYPGTITKFSMHYLLVWMSIGICYSKQIRNMSDESIKNIFTATKTKTLPQNQF